MTIVKQKSIDATSQRGIQHNALDQPTADAQRDSSQSFYRLWFNPRGDSLRGPSSRGLYARIWAINSGKRLGRSSNNNSAVAHGDFSVREKKSTPARKAAIDNNRVVSGRAAGIFTQPNFLGEADRAGWGGGGNKKDSEARSGRDKSCVTTESLKGFGGP